MEFERYDNGVPSWVDMGVPGPGEARGFLRRACSGWDCPEGPPEAGGYSVCMLGEVGGRARPEDEPGGPPCGLPTSTWTASTTQWPRSQAAGGMVFMPAHGRHGGRADGHLRRPDWRRDRPLAARSSTRVPSWPTSPAPTAGANWSPPTSTASKAFYKAVFGWDAASKAPAGAPRCTPSGSWGSAPWAA